MILPALPALVRLKICFPVSVRQYAHVVSMSSCLHGEPTVTVCLSDLIREHAVLGMREQARQEKRTSPLSDENG